MQQLLVNVIVAHCIVDHQVNHVVDDFSADAAAVDDDVDDDGGGDADDGPDESGGRDHSNKYDAVDAAAADGDDGHTAGLAGYVDQVYHQHNVHLFDCHFH